MRKRERLLLPLQRRLNAAARALLEIEGSATVDFSLPSGEPSLTAPDSVSWRIFKNPVALFIGGVTAVILELAEPRVRTGIWDYTSFRDKPVQRLRRTGLAAMMTVYGPRSMAEAMITRINRMHRHVKGVTPDGRPYAADDPELLDWVFATASFGFVQAYHHYVQPLTLAERNRYYAERMETAHLYGTQTISTSEAQMEAHFAAMSEQLEPSEIIFEFLEIMQRAPLLPPLLQPVQRLFVRAAIDLTPEWARHRLGLKVVLGLRPWEPMLVRNAGLLADRMMLDSTPPIQACRRLGLPDNYLYVRDKNAYAA